MYEILRMRLKRVSLFFFAMSIVCCQLLHQHLLLPGALYCGDPQHSWKSLWFPSCHINALRPKSASLIVIVERSIRIFSGLISAEKDPKGKRKRKRGANEKEAKAAGNSNYFSVSLANRKTSCTSMSDAL